MITRKFSSWSGQKSEQEFIAPTWRFEKISFDHSSSYLPYGLGRSYGDSCLNSGGKALLSSELRRFMAFDASTGILRAESGVTLREILQLTLKQGWFLPVSPGTQYVTLGGAIANDVHGKNHHLDGSFGHHVLHLSLVRSNGEVFSCSAQENSELFSASIGGLGLTGFILDACIQLKKVSGPWIDQEQIKFGQLSDYFKLAEESSSSPYTMSWIDCTSATQAGAIKGIFIRGQHSSSTKPHTADPKAILQIPFEVPVSPLNFWSIKAFNTLYYWKNRQERLKNTVSYVPFFYPLDAVSNWNRIYGPQGLLQYQSVVPQENAYEVTRQMLHEISKSGQASFLGVLKTFGNQKAPGILSFPRPGLTLALDFKNTGNDLERLFRRLDNIVFEAGGALYPAKDSRMSPEAFKKSFPNWTDFLKYKDPLFSSSFWRRITDDKENL